MKNKTRYAVVESPGDGILQSPVTWHDDDPRILPPALFEALEVAYSCGSIRAADHRAWVIDQMVRKLTGDLYENWVRNHNQGEDGPDTYAWDIGVAP
jgi:hypothetical protein